MNFIIKLPSSKELMTNVVFNLIIIAVDRLIKDIIFILFKEVATADKLTYIFFRNIVTEYILKKKLITD